MNEIGTPTVNEARTPTMNEDEAGGILGAERRLGLHSVQLAEGILHLQVARLQHKTQRAIMQHTAQTGPTLAGGTAATQNTNRPHICTWYDVHNNFSYTRRVVDTMR